MIVLCVTNCPQGLRGDLSKWLSEVNTGVYVGKLSARVREELWDRVCDNIKSGQATMVYTASNEQGFTFLTHNTVWTPIDYEGITLMCKPLTQQEEETEALFLQDGFSKAAKYEKARTFSSRRKSSDYIVIDVETTGLDYNNDRIVEIGMLKISDGEVKEKFQCLVQSDRRITDDITELTGITAEMIERQGLKEEKVFDLVEKLSATI